MNKYLLGTIAAFGITTPANAATFLSESGFGELGGFFSSCKTGSSSGAFASGQVLSMGDYSGSCVGAYSVELDTVAKTITLTGFEHGNYVSGFLSISGITEAAITGLNTLSYVGLFDPDFYGEPDFSGGIPEPQLSFTADSIEISFSTFGESPPQFIYDGDGGQAVFSYATATGAVPEPATWAFMIFGFGAIGGALRRNRKANVKVSYA